MTDADTGLMLRGLSALLYSQAHIMEKNELEDDAKVLNELGNEIIGHLNWKQKEAAAPSKFITDAVRDLENRDWPSDLNPPDRPARREKKP